MHGLYVLIFDVLFGSPFEFSFLFAICNQSSKQDEVYKLETSTSNLVQF